MARIQALKQLRFTESSNAPISSAQVEGGFSNGGVSKMHPLKSSNPVFKAASLIHGLRTSKMRMPRLKLKLPKL